MNKFSNTLPTDNAIRIVDRQIERGESVGEQFRRGRIVPEYHDETIREVFEGDYRIIYKILSECIDILTVRHCSQLLPVEAVTL